MLRESQTCIVARNETWCGEDSTEPMEAGWASEAIFFVRALKNPVGPPAVAEVQISPDGMRWVAEGTTLTLPAVRDAMVMAKVAHFGNWLRLAATALPGSECVVLVTLHLK